MPNVITKDQLFERLGPICDLHRRYPAILMRGIPGSGKSTLLNEILSKVGHQTCSASADDFRMVDGEYIFRREDNAAVHQACLRRFIEAAQRDGHDAIACDNTNLGLEFAPYYAIAEAYGWEPLVINVVADPHEAFRRGLHGVPEAQILRMHERFQRDLPGNFNAVWVKV